MKELREPGTNEQYVVCYDMSHIYGLYADTFEFDQPLRCNYK